MKSTIKGKLHCTIIENPKLVAVCGCDRLSNIQLYNLDHAVINKKKFNEKVHYIKASKS